ncbi:MAG: aminotransferase class I/II-fold pyridoxal phosphate-dependent enzyme, partial [Bryobacteraceae bacterium]|nr:aminotransferase class I/II-fold pyridoxal phosphate-dependent enzyme [Bryobacteraceae bacterium]
YVLDPGAGKDTVVVTSPGYPIPERGARFAGARVLALPLAAERGFLPDLDALDRAEWDRVALLWLNYPNNPTAATADLEFLTQAVAFAREHDLLLCYDNPYCDVLFDGYVAPSILQVPGAKDVALEFNSLSKTYNMAGWRVGMAVGSAQAVEALGQAISLKQDFAAAYTARGDVRASAGDYDGAVSDYSMALELYPDYAQAYYKRALA